VCVTESEEGDVQFVDLPVTQCRACIYIYPLPETLPLFALRILTIILFSDTLSMCSALTKTL
jgi:hypothetical protein